MRADEGDTQLVMRRWRNTTRLYRNKITEEVSRIERESKEGKFEEVQPLMSGKRGREVFINGDVDYGVWTAGQVIVLIHGKFLSLRDIVFRILIDFKCGYMSWHG